MRALLMAGLLLCFGCPRAPLPAPLSDVCAPLTCASAGAECGVLPDGCGNRLYCGGCPLGGTCGGGGASNRCGEGPCTRTTCEEIKAQCGLVSDGCDDILECGACPPGERCSDTNQCVAEHG